MERAGPEVLEALRVSQALKEDTVRSEGVGADIAMTLHLIKDGVLLGAATLEGERDDVLLAIVAIVGLSDADQVVHVSEAYAIHKPDEDALTRGNLARAFADGDPNVFECLNVVAVRIDGRTSALQASYTYQGRTVKWGEPTDIAGGADSDFEMSGDFPDAILTGYECQKVRPVDALDPSDISKLLGCSIVVPKSRRA